MAKDIAIVLNNGSINSAVTTALASQRYRIVTAYGDSSGVLNSRRHGAYQAQVSHFKPARDHMIPMQYVSGLATGAENTTGVEVRPLVVQLTNLLPLLGAAARLAAHHQAAAIYLGLRVGPGGDDLATASEYMQIWNELLQIPCAQPDLDVVTPLLELEPWQVIEVGFQVNAPLERTWSCMEEVNDPCWACRGCRAREAAFQQAAKADPIRLVKK